VVLLVTLINLLIFLDLLNNQKRTCNKVRLSYSILITILPLFFIGDNTSRVFSYFLNIAAFMLLRLKIIRYFANLLLKWYELKYELHPLV
jgi:hypothetical protein